ncbi:formylglycine-generating enzyme family protein [Candidatus Bipolaricaulota bacterium]|nr:formylglycine-generating enzyme family protein [Candidatus Bipolaricaulota bacterium]
MSNSLMPQLSYIPDSTFPMGISTCQLEELVQADAEAACWEKSGRFDREQPCHEVDIRSFYLAKTCVTVADYRRFVDEQGYHHRSWWTSSGWEWRQTENRSGPAFVAEGSRNNPDMLPIVGVTWYEATAYCRWLSHRTGRLFRLPTEAEWEFSARGPNGHLYPWGSSFRSAFCNTRSGNVGHTLPVGTRSPLGDSPFGLQDMVGNVSEWTSSQFRPYPYVATDGREVMEGESERTTRGGSWFGPDLRARTTSRGMNVPWFCDDDLGFRVAMSEWPVQS